MRKIVLFLSLAMSIFSTYAQDANSSEELGKKKEINEIKLSEQAHYAEVVIEMVTDDNEAVSLAQQQSIALLQTHVIEIFAKRLNMSKKDVQEIWDVIDDKCQNIEVRKGDLLKVFSYMAKDALKGWLGNKKVKPLSPEDSLILFGPTEVDDSKIKSILSTEEKVVNLGNNLIKVDEKKEEAKGTVQPEVVIPKPTEKPKPESKPEPKVEPKPEKKEVVIPELCQNIIKQGNLKALGIFLNQEKSKQKLMYGGASKMHYQSKCYMIAIDKSSELIVAVLDKGDARRMNFMTGEMDNMENYRGKYAVIFVQEY